MGLCSGNCLVYFGEFKKNCKGLTVRPVKFQKVKVPTNGGNDPFVQKKRQVSSSRHKKIQRVINHKNAHKRNKGTACTVGLNEH